MFQNYLYLEFELVRGHPSGAQHMCSGPAWNLNIHLTAFLSHCHYFLKSQISLFITPCPCFVAQYSAILVHVDVHVNAVDFRQVSWSADLKRYSHLSKTNIMERFLAKIHIRHQGCRSLQHITLRQSSIHVTLKIRAQHIHLRTQQTFLSFRPISVHRNDGSDLFKDGILFHPYASVVLNFVIRKPHLLLRMMTCLPAQSYAGTWTSKQNILGANLLSTVKSLRRFAPAACSRPRTVDTLTLW